MLRVQLKRYIRPDSYALWKFERFEKLLEQRAKQEYLKEIIDEYDNATAGCNDISVFEEWLLEQEYKLKHEVD